MSRVSPCVRFVRNRRSIRPRSVRAVSGHFRRFVKHSARIGKRREKDSSGQQRRHPLEPNCAATMIVLRRTDEAKKLTVLPRCQYGNSVCAGLQGLSPKTSQSFFAKHDQNLRRINRRINQSNNNLFITRKSDKKCFDKVVIYHAGRCSS